jgi:hypothetical protein
VPIVEEAKKKCQKRGWDGLEFYFDSLDTAWFHVLESIWLQPDESIIGVFWTFPEFFCEGYVVVDVCLNFFVLDYSSFAFCSYCALSLIFFKQQAEFCFGILFYLLDLGVVGTSGDKEFILEMYERHRPHSRLISFDGSKENVWFPTKTLPDFLYQLIASIIQRQFLTNLFTL